MDKGSRAKSSIIAMLKRYNKTCYGYHCPAAIAFLSSIPGYHLVNNQSHRSFSKTFRLGYQHECRPVTEASYLGFGKGADGLQLEKQVKTVAVWGIGRRR